MSEKSPPLYVCSSPAVPCADLVLAADILARVKTRLACVDKRAMDRESVIYLEEAVSDIEALLAQFTRWTRNDG